MSANSNGIGEFSSQFHDEIAADANALELLKEHMFVEKMGELLVEYGEIEDMIRSSYKGHGLKIDGYHFDDEFNTLTLVISHFIDGSDPTNSKLNKTDLESAFKRGVNFLTKSAKGLHNKIEIANEAHDLSSLIYECRNELESVKIILVTDGFTKARPAQIYEVDGFIIKLV
ncbi:hypothetical protein K8T06_04775, partial [bacterium]|nr:hypothetical protein [bacterium]